MQEDRHGLLTAQQVQCMFGVDRSTVYRMAADGTLPAVKIGRQWRFPADKIEKLTRDVDADSRSDVELHGLAGCDGVSSVIAEAVVAVSAPLLGVTMVVTDMQGRPITGLANACPRLAADSADRGVVAECLHEWRDLVDEVDLEPRFRRGPLGFECARAFVRIGTELVAMVVAGGVVPAGEPADGLHQLDEAHRHAVLAALPRIAATLSRAAIGRPTADVSIDLDRLELVHATTNTRSVARRTVEVAR
ncbi:MAG TPA: helix-turn-helix domain-containing protein [Mycobacterium sp.]|nr:helix-turn-helix domain-containing protein [Mycobacterium sp.]